MGLFGFDAHTALQPVNPHAGNGALHKACRLPPLPTPQTGLCLAEMALCSALCVSRTVENAPPPVRVAIRSKPWYASSAKDVGRWGDNTWGAGPHANLM